MIEKIVIASDSFKGSISSGKVARAAAEAIQEVFPECEIKSLEMADGGEGTLDALCRNVGGTKVACKVQDPLGRTIDAEYALSGDLAIIEMAKASGLTLIPLALRNPLNTTTFGTGQLITDALAKGCRRFLIGIGGSATNDAGTGMLTALGWRFLDKDVNILPPTGASLEHIASIDDNGRNPLLDDCVFSVACDVDTPFCGPEGAAFVFAPQKGADPDTVQRLDEGMASFSKLIFQATGMDVRDLPGAGATGGLGGALKAFLDAELKPGAELVLETAGFASISEGADLIITGEGRMDAQTSKGKAPYTVLRHAMRLGIPTIALVGSVSDIDEVKSLGFKDILPINPPGLPLETALLPDTAYSNIRLTLLNYLQSRS